MLDQYSSSVSICITHGRGHLTAPAHSWNYNNNWLFEHASVRVTAHKSPDVMRQRPTNIMCRSTELMPKEIYGTRLIVYLYWLSTRKCGLLLSIKFKMYWKELITIINYTRCFKDYVQVGWSNRPQLVTALFFKNE